MAIIDADSHMFEQPGLWRDHLPADLRHLALGSRGGRPRVHVVDPQGQASAPVLHQRARQALGVLWIAAPAPARGKPSLTRYTEMPATYRDPAARRDALDGWGIDEQVIFPNWGLNFGWYLQGDVESEIANIVGMEPMGLRGPGGGSRSLAAGRALLVAGRSRPGSDEKLAELAAAGITQVFLPAGLVDGRRMSHPDFDPVWAQMNALGLAPTFHIGAFAERIIADGWQDNDVIQYMTTQSLVMTGLDVQIALADLILNGVFDRFPDLVWIVTEYTVGWLPQLGFQLDLGFDIHYEVTAEHNVRLPSDPRSTSIGTSVACRSRASSRGKIMDAVGDILMFGSDYPHAEGQADPLRDYQQQVGDMGQRHDALLRRHVRDRTRVCPSDPRLKRTEVLVPQPLSVPSFLTRCANDEFIPPPLNDVERAAAWLAAAVSRRRANGCACLPSTFAETRRGIATGLLGCQQRTGGVLRHPARRHARRGAADEALGGDQSSSMCRRTTSRSGPRARATGN